ncbi:hypothetical protein pb186bvf_005876 [Paramecium bursaria]
MQLLVNYFELLSELERCSEVIRQMIAEYFDEQLIERGIKFLFFILPYRVRSLNQLGCNKNLSVCEDLIDKLQQMEIQYQDKLYNIKQKLHIDLIEVYKWIDPQQDGYIDYIKLKRFLLQQNAIVVNEDIMNIFKRMDRDQDGFISLGEFVLELAIRQRSKSTNYSVSKKQSTANTNTNYTSFHTSHVSTYQPSQFQSRYQSLRQSKRQSLSVSKYEQCDKLQNTPTKQDCFTFYNFLEKYIELIQPLLEYNIQPLNYINIDIDYEYQWFWGIKDQDISYQNNEKIMQFMQATIEATPKMKLLKRNLIKKKQSSYLQLFQNLTDDKLNIEQVKLNIDEEYHKSLEQLFEYFNPEDPENLEFSQFLRFFSI